MDGIGCYSPGGDFGQSGSLYLVGDMIRSCQFLVGFSSVIIPHGVVDPRS